MPWTIHNEALKRQWNFNISRPQEQVPDVLPENFQGTVNQAGCPSSISPTGNFPNVCTSTLSFPLEQFSIGTTGMKLSTRKRFLWNI